MAYVVLAIAAAQQYSAGKKADGIADANAKREEEEATEAARKLKLQQDRILGETRARSAASGIDADSGTVQAYMSEMQKNFSDELDWIKKSGASAADIRRREGSYQRQAATAKAWGTLASIDYSGMG